MEEDIVLTKSEFCFACLSVCDEKHLKNFVFFNESLRFVLKDDLITLCSQCIKIAQRVDNLVQNVQTSQKLLEDLVLINKSTLDSTRSGLRPLIDLKCQDLDVIELDGVGNEDGFIVYPSKTWRDVEVKLEMKIEDYDNRSEEDLGHDDFQDISFDIKEEANLELPSKNEIENYEPTKKKKRGRPKKKDKLETIFNDKTVSLGIIERVYISKEEVMSERVGKAANQAYVEAAMKCETCIKVFQFKDTYERHMKRHCESAGDYECDICRQRMESPIKLKSHQKYHRIRFKCSKCDVTKVCAPDVRQHYREVHEGQTMLLSCSHCSKTFNSDRKLKKHEKRHLAEKRAPCRLCRKTYADQQVLKMHMATVHGHQILASNVLKRTHKCPVCEKLFRTPSYLKKHLLIHTDKKEFYCVECDKTFKSEYSLKTHLKTTKLHLNELELRFPCQHCDRKFSVRRDVERHTNSIHLNVRPYKCDKCDKAYVSKWALKEHRELTHEGRTRARRYPCPMCDKVFDRNQILTSHLRTHTGERPFACSDCGASFAQRSVLRTHVRLVHLRLARDGRPRT